MDTGSISGTGRSTKEKYIKITEYGSEYWFIKDYRLYLQTAWGLIVEHVGDIEHNPTKPLKVIIEIPK